jgi:NitT/TauT family transport system ATP-binding protein
MGFTLQNIAKTFSDRRSETRALADVSFHVDDREFICIVGPSGCGKSTLLKIIARLALPSSGYLQFDTEPSAGRIRCAMVFQDPGLFPWMTVRQNAAFGLEMRGVPAREARRIAAEYVERIGLAEFKENYPRELSGGMLQRVAIARALLSDPEILLMDEPFGALDAQTRLVLQEELLRIWEEQRKTVVYVTHDIEEALLMADRVLVLSGRPARVRETVVVEEARSERRKPERRQKLLEQREHIWSLIEDEVRADLHIGSYGTKR